MNNQLTRKIIGCAIEVHRALGPGLMESAYQQCLAQEFIIQQIQYEQEKKLPVHYKNITLNCGYRIDFLIQNQIILELKSVQETLPIHEAQLLTYMKLSKIKLGLLINFNVKLLKNGIKRFVL